MLDPDGKFRTVKYTADKHNGFHARIFADGHEYPSYPPPQSATAHHPTNGPGDGGHDESSEENHEHSDAGYDEAGDDDSGDDGDDAEDDEGGDDSNEVRVSGGSVA